MCKVFTIVMDFKLALNSVIETELSSRLCWKQTWHIQFLKEVSLLWLRRLKS
jgi:hypothetical protein